MAKNVLWLYGIQEESGYARNSRDFIKALNLNGLNVKFDSLGHKEYPEREIMKQYEAPENFKPDVIIHNVIPPCFKRRGGRQENILMTFAETDRVPSDWVPMCDTADRLFTQSYFSKAAFVFSGAKKPIIVAHTPTDIERINSVYNSTVPYVNVNKADGEFVFFANSEWTPRKGWDILIAAFYKTFHKYEFAHLVIKTCSFSGVENSDSIKFMIKSEKIKYENAKCKVSVINDVSTIEEVWSLYNLADCFVLPSRGEAGGIPYMESMALGIPIICPSKGGQIDYINDDIAVTVKSNYEKAFSMPHNRFYNDSMYWINTDIDDLGYKMMNIAANFDIERFKKGQEIFKRNFGFDGNNIKKIAKYIEEQI